MVCVTVTWRSWGGVNVSLFIRWECGISTYRKVSTLSNRGVNKSRTSLKGRAALVFLVQRYCPRNLFQCQKVGNQVGQVLLAQRLAVRHYHG